jgi:hypothetical protein
VRGRCASSGCKNEAPVTQSAPLPLNPAEYTGTGITTNNVISSAARIVGIVDSKLRVIEDVEGLRAELKLARLPYLEMLQQRQVEIQAVRIIQKVPARVPECETPGSHKLRGIADERSEAP